MARKLSRNNNFIEFSGARFLKELGSDSSSPGGGAAAALIGAVGVSLIEMVSRINEKRSQKKLDRKSPSPQVKAHIPTLIKLRTRFGALMKLDAEAFLKLSQFSKEKRFGALYEKALKTAAGVPLEMARLTQQALSLGEPEVVRTSRWLASDLAEAAILLEASYYSARLNVEINLRSIQDARFLSNVKTELADLEKMIGRSKANLLKVLTDD